MIFQWFPESLGYSCWWYLDWFDCMINFQMQRLSKLADTFKDFWVFLQYFFFGQATNALVIHGLNFIHSVRYVLVIDLYQIHLLCCPAVEEVDVVYLPRQQISRCISCHWLGLSTGHSIFLLVPKVKNCTFLVVHSWSVAKTFYSYYVPRSSVARITLHVAPVSIGKLVFLPPLMVMVA